MKVENGKWKVAHGTHAVIADETCSVIAGLTRNLTDEKFWEKDCGSLAAMTVIARNVGMNVAKTCKKH